MKIYKLPQLTDLTSKGEYCLSNEGEGSRSGPFIVYGKLRPNEQGRCLAPKAGQIFYGARGHIRVRHDRSDFMIGEGEAFHLKGTAIILDNAGSSEAAYIIAGENSISENKIKEAKEELPACVEEPAQDTDDADGIVID